MEEAAPQDPGKIAERIRLEQEAVRALQEVPRVRRRDLAILFLPSALLLVGFIITMITSPGESRYDIMLWTALVFVWAATLTLATTLRRLSEGQRAFEIWWRFLRDEREREQMQRGGKG